MTEVGEIPEDSLYVFYGIPSGGVRKMETFVFPKTVRSGLRTEQKCVGSFARIAYLVLVRGESRLQGQVGRSGDHFQYTLKI